MEIFAADVGPQLEVLVQVAIAMLLGGAVGIERELSNKPAGFRTHMLVAGAAALFIGLADALAAKFAHEAYANVLRIEPIRIVGAIITGISFLGAGTIFRAKGGPIEGLTTAASILLVSAIGIAVALNQLVLALSVTVLVLFVLTAMRFVENFFARMRK
ncbi:MAG: MgtC/SapB family protein [Gammaproteobacteria bacterium]